MPQKKVSEMYSSTENLMCRMGDRAQQVQMLGAESKDLSSIPGTHMIEEGN